MEPNQCPPSQSSLVPRNGRALRWIANDQGQRIDAVHHFCVYGLEAACLGAPLPLDATLGGDGLDTMTVGKGSKGSRNVPSNQSDSFLTSLSRIQLEIAGKEWVSRSYRCLNTLQTSTPASAHPHVCVSGASKVRASRGGLNGRHFVTGHSSVSCAALPLHGKTRNWGEARVALAG
jgi:hypothetical protein